MRSKASMLDSWLDEWSARLDEIEKESNRDEIMEIELLEKYTVFMMRLMQTPSKPCCIIIDEVDGAAGGGMGAAAGADIGAGTGGKGFAHVVQVLQSCIQYSNTLKSKQKEEELEDVVEEP